MAGRAVLRLFAFEPAGTPRLLDARLRDEIAPRIAELPGLTALFLARRAGDRWSIESHRLVPDRSRHI